jgi:hypothetical protein
MISYYSDLNLNMIGGHSIYLLLEYIKKEFYFKYDCRTLERATWVTPQKIRRARECPEKYSKIAMRNPRSMEYWLLGKIIS